MRENRTSRTEAPAAESVSLVRTLPAPLASSAALAATAPSPHTAESAPSASRKPRPVRGSTPRTHKPRATPRVKATATPRDKKKSSASGPAKSAPRTKSAATPRPQSGWLHRTWTRLVTALKPWVRPALRLAAGRRLQLIEMQQLGDKRFLAIARVGEQTYLIGGGATSIVLLAELDRTVRPLAAPRELSAEAS